MIHATNGVLAQLGEMGDMINYVVSPISIPVKPSTFKPHVNKNAFLVHCTDKMPVAMDEAGVLEFLQPLFFMQQLGSRNNVLIATDERLAVADALLAWQLFGGIAMPTIGSVDATLKVLDQMLQIPLNGISGSKRAIQFATNRPYPELDICDEWTMEQVMVYAMINGHLPDGNDDKQLFNMSQLDRNVLLQKVKEMNDDGSTES